MRPPKILDNKQQGRVIDELRQGIEPGAKMSVIENMIGFCKVTNNRSSIYFQHVGKPHQFFASSPSALKIFSIASFMDVTGTRPSSVRR